MASKMHASSALFLLLVVFFVDVSVCEEEKTQAEEFVDEGFRVEVTKDPPNNCESYRPAEVVPHKRQAQDGDEVFIDYTVYGGSVKLDASQTFGKQFNFTLGSGTVMRGMEKAIRGMCIGEERKMSIKYNGGETFPDTLAKEKKIAVNTTLEYYVIMQHIFRPQDDKLIIKTLKGAPADCPRRTQDEDYIHKHYTAYLKSNSRKVDSSIERKSESHFTIGAGEVIKGMDIGVLEMCVGEQRRLYVPPHLAYGERGSGEVPEHATMVIDIEVTHIHRPGVDNLEVEVIKAGPKNCTRKVEVGDVIFKHYTAYLPNGTKFDSSFDRDKEYWFKVGAEPREVIQGMDEGIRGLCVGEKRKITMPSLMAYGQTGVEGKIPPHSPLIFEVELMHIYRPSEDKLQVEVMTNTSQCDKAEFHPRPNSLRVPLHRRSQKDDHISMHYTGYFTNGTVFDEAYAKDQVWTFVLGTGDAIKGLDDGMLEMCVGEKRRITMPPHLAFGMQGMKFWNIPPHATVIFEVELTKIVQPSELKTEL